MCYEIEWKTFFETMSGSRYMIHDGYLFRLEGFTELRGDREGLRIIGDYVLCKGFDGEFTLAYGDSIFLRRTTPVITIWREYVRETKV